MLLNNERKAYDNVKKNSTSGVKGVGIGHMRFHGLRHTFPSHLVMSDVDFRTIQQLMGYKTIQVRVKVCAMKFMLMKINQGEMHNRNTANRAVGRSETSPKRR